MLRQLRHVADSLDALVAYVDGEGRYRFANRRHEEWLGRSTDELSSLTLREGLGDEAYADIAPHLAAALAGDERRFEGALRHRERGARRVEVRLVPDVEDGRVEGLAVFVTDLGPASEEARGVARGLQHVVELEKIAASLSQAATPLEVARAALPRALEALGAEAGCVHLLSEDRARLELLECTGVMPEVVEPFRSIPVEVSTVGNEPLRTRRPVFVETPEQREAHSAWRSGWHGGTTATLPLLAGGEVIGVLGFGFSSWRPLSSDERAFLVAIAELCSQALDRARLLDEALRRERRAEVLARASETFARVGGDLEDLLRVVVDVIVDATGDPCSLRLLSEDGAWLDTVAFRHPDPEAQREGEELLRAERQRAREGLSARTLSSRRTQVVTGLGVEEQKAMVAPRYHRWVERYPTHSIICAPLVVEGKAIGTLSVGRSRGAPYDPEDVAIVEALAERAALAIERSRLVEHLRAAVHLRDDFLSIASHELRTPLAALVLGVSLARQRRERGVGDVDDALLRVERSARRMARLVDVLLDVSRLSSGSLSLDRRPLDLRLLVEEVVDQEREAARRAGCDLRFARPAGEVVGAWDRERLEQVVANLLHNAVKYGAGAPIDVEVGTSDGQACLIVRDRGIGVDAGDQQRIFDRFERAVSSKHFGGFGVGLWVARQVVEAHGGRIDIESRAGQGATFIVRLPLSRVDVDEARPHA